MVCFGSCSCSSTGSPCSRPASLNDNPNNTREILRDFSQPRGTVTTADGVVLARSVPSDDRFELQREYPEGPLFAHVTGFFSFTLGSSGVEQTYNDELAGRTLGLSLQDLGDLFVDKDRVGDLTLVDPGRPPAGRGRRSSATARARSSPSTRAPARSSPWSRTRPTTPTCWPTTTLPRRPPRQHGASTPTPRSPAWPAPTRSASSPGSTFKVVTATAGSCRGKVTADEPELPGAATATRRRGTNRPIRNFGGASCGGTLLDVLRVSCNSVFAQMGVDTGPEAMIAHRRGASGSTTTCRSTSPGPARSTFPTDFTRNTPALAQSAIGQNDVSATPLQMAMVAAAVANERQDHGAPRAPRRPRHRRQHRRPLRRRTCGRRPWTPAPPPSCARP